MGQGVYFAELNGHITLCRSLSVLSCDTLIVVNTGISGHLTLFGHFGHDAAQVRKSDIRPNLREARTTGIDPNAACIGQLAANSANTDNWLVGAKPGICRKGHVTIQTAGKPTKQRTMDIGSVSGI